MSESIKQAFIKKDNSEPQGFSLLAAFGRKDQDSDEESGLWTVKTGCDIIEPRHEKTNVLHMRKQRRRTASR